jgi:hypothetical protein
VNTEDEYTVNTKGEYAVCNEHTEGCAINTAGEYVMDPTGEYAVKMSICNRH